MSSATTQLALRSVQRFQQHAQSTVRRFPGPTPAQTLVTARNPFLPQRNTFTGRWAPPRYSLRRQADLVKQAKLANVTHLLPPGPKMAKPPKLESNEDFWARITWTGKLKAKPKKGADIGARLYAGKKRMFKGHKWERLRPMKEAHRKNLLRDMKQRIFMFKHYYKFRRPDPIAPPKMRGKKKTKLPF